MLNKMFLFDVGRGQCFAIRGDSGNWHVFDLGSSDNFSPVEWIARNSTAKVQLGTLVLTHYHGDHLGDIKKLNAFDVYDLKHVDHEDTYLMDCMMSNSEESRPLLNNAVQFAKSFNGSRPWCYDDNGIEISHKRLSLSDVRQIGGSAGTRVNNSSIVSKIKLNGTSILVCGDMEQSGWEFIFNKLSLGETFMWKWFLSDIDMLIAPHHGHASGFSCDLMRIVKPALVLASVSSQNPHVDERYSKEEFTRGYIVNGETRRLLTTRSDGHIGIDVEEEPFSRKIHFVFGSNALK